MSVFIDPCGVSSPVVPTDDPKVHHAACPLCLYVSVPMAKPQARAAAQQHRESGRHREALMRAAQRETLDR